MKKIFRAVFVVMLAMSAFSSCSDVPAPYEILEPDVQGGVDQGVTGEGTKDKPYSVLAAQQNQNGSLAWVEGYIVGTLENVYDDKGDYAGSKPNFEVPFNITSNILIAASADEKDEKKCLPVKIKNGSELSNVLNLKDHPENLKGHLLIQGKLSKGFGKPALIETKAAVFNGKEIGTAGQGGEVNPQPEKPAETVVVTNDKPYEESFASSFGSFRVQDVTLGGLTYVWKIDTDRKYAKASAFKGQGVVAESHLVSPELDLTALKKAALTFSQCSFSAGKADEFMLKVKNITDNVDWKNLDFEMTTEKWKWIDNTVDLSAYAGKKIQLAFVYKNANTSKANTWEVKNVKVSNGEAGGQGGGQVDPTPKPEPGVADLFISEYVEGSSSEKYIEIYNPTDNEVDLSAYVLNCANNGKTWGDEKSYTYQPLSGKLAAKSVKVYKNGNATKYADAEVCKACGFNGEKNDAVGLFKNGTLIDVFGYPVDKTADASFGKDITYRRKSTVSAPVAKFNLSEWEEAPKDDISGLGKR